MLVSLNNAQQDSPFYLLFRMPGLGIHGRYLLKDVRFLPILPPSAEFRPGEGELFSRSGIMRDLGLGRDTQKLCSMAYCPSLFRKFCHLQACMSKMV